MGLLGAHVSTAGGVARAFERGEAIGCEAIQIFVKRPNQWRARPLAQKEIDAFRLARDASPQPVVAHAAYLINLCSPKDDIREKSMAALLIELQRCSKLGVDGLVVHPGAHAGEGVDAGTLRIARSLDALLALDPGITTRLLLENTAGQGSAIGSSFAELGRIIELAEQRDRIGICLDTCHAFAAGYDLSTEAGYRSTFSELNELVGAERLACIHLNDSKHELGSRKDRHDNIGAGHLGTDCFARLVNDPALAGLPMILETPTGEDGDGHRDDLTTLKALRS